MNTPVHPHSNGCTQGQRGLDDGGRRDKPLDVDFQDAVYLNLKIITVMNILWKSQFRKKDKFIKLAIWDSRFKFLNTFHTLHIHPYKPFKYIKDEISNRTTKIEST